MEWIVGRGSQLVSGLDNGENIVIISVLESVCVIFIISLNVHDMAILSLIR